jgi:HD-like signal output (HDOD) protein
MGFNALVLILALLVTVALWFLLRKPKTKSRPPSTKPRSAALVRQHNAKGTEPAELPTVEADALESAQAKTQPLPSELERFHLIVAADIDKVTFDRVEAICTNMPEPHPVQKQLAEGLDTPSALMDAVASDAGLTASILRTVNSAAFSLASPITSVQHAITYLGVSIVKGLVAQGALAEQTVTGTPEQQAALSRIWTSACTASAVAQMLCKELGIDRPSVLATRALFFNLGDVALVLSDEGHPAWYADNVSIVERINGQQSACSANTAIVGSTLARLWNLPDDIADAIESGLMPLVTPPAEHPMEGGAHRDNVLMYLAGRIGDCVAYRGLRDIGELDLVDSQEPDLFYLAGHLNAAGLGRVLALLQDNAFRRKTNRVLMAPSG